MSARSAIQTRQQTLRLLSPPLPALKQILPRSSPIDINTAVCPNIQTQCLQPPPQSPPTSSPPPRRSLPRPLLNSPPAMTPNGGHTKSAQSAAPSNQINIIDFAINTTRDQAQRLHSPPSLPRKRTRSQAPSLDTVPISSHNPAEQLQPQGPLPSSPARMASPLAVKAAINNQNQAQGIQLPSSLSSGQPRSQVSILTNSLKGTPSEVASMHQTATHNSQVNKIDFAIASHQEAQRPSSARPSSRTSPKVGSPLAGSPLTGIPCDISSEVGAAHVHVSTDNSQPCNTPPDASATYLHFSTHNKQVNSTEINSHMVCSKIAGRAGIDMQKHFFEALPGVKATRRQVQEWIAIWLFAHNVPHNGAHGNADWTFNISAIQLSGHDINRMPLDKLQQHLLGPYPGLDLGCGVVLTKDIERARALAKRHSGRSASKTASSAIS